MMKITITRTPSGLWSFCLQDSQGRRMPLNWPAMSELMAKAHADRLNARPWS